MDESTKMKKVIMIADDSSTVRKFVAFSLKMNQFEVVMAEDGMDAMEKISQNQVDLAIVDLNMPNMDGFEFIETIRKTDDYKNLPIIILSSEKSEESIQKGKSVGADSYLVKPFNAKMIQYHVAKFLDE